MDFLFWDASALVKRYTPETGSEIADTLFVETPPPAHLTTLWSYSETYAILCRKLNDRRIDLNRFRFAVRRLEEDFLKHSDVMFLNVDDSALLTGLTHIRHHHLNSVDATLLSVLLQFVGRLNLTDRLFLVTADKRLVRAAEAEGIRALDPEVITEGEIAALLRGT